MAEPDEIEAVLRMLGPDAESEGFGHEQISERLDEGRSSEQIAQDYWEFRMASTASLVNVTESGSSRTLSDIHKHAVEMAKYYKSVNDRDEEQEQGARRGRRSIVLRKV